MLGRLARALRWRCFQFNDKHGVFCMPQGVFFEVSWVQRAVQLGRLGPPPFAPLLMLIFPKRPPWDQNPRFPR